MGLTDARVRLQRIWIRPAILACIALVIPTLPMGLSTQALATSSPTPAIVVVSHPQMAALLIDGVDFGLSTPATISSLRPGAHQLSLVIPGFDPWETSITMPATGTMNVVAGLKVASGPVGAATVTVTTNSDASNGDVSSIAALIANPGPDGISLREALSAANATAGSKTIGFAPALKGTTITPGDVTGLALPQLLGGGTSIIGDIDGDGIPDITLDGRFGRERGPIGNTFDIWSSDNRISGLRIINSREPILLAPPSDWAGPAKTLTDNQVLGNSIAGDTGIFVGALGLITATANPVPMSNLTWKQLVIAGNDVDASQAIFLYAGTSTSHDNLIADVTIAANWVNGMSGSEGTDGIALWAADANSAYGQVPVPTPILFADHNRIQNVTIERNHIDNAKKDGVSVGAANMGNSDNVVSDVHILNNQIRVLDPNLGPTEGVGIMLMANSDPGPGGGRTARGNTLQRVEVRGNTIANAAVGIRVEVAENWGSGPWWSGSPLVSASTANIVEDVLIADNVVALGPGRWGRSGILAGAALMHMGSCPASYNVMRRVTISGNHLRDGTRRAVGIQIATGTSGAGAVVSHNAIEALVISGNVLTGWGTGLIVAAGHYKGATANALAGRAVGNVFTSTTVRFKIVADYEGASGNSVHFTRS